MASSTLRLSEYAKVFVFPATITRTVWPRVESKGVELGLGFDWWQSQAGTVILGYREDGKYAATVGGVGMSIPRQVGKTYFVLAMLVILCLLFPGLQVVWTAHHLRTSTKTFTTLRGLCRRRKIAPHVRAMRSANGEQQVEFVNGSMIMFGARAQGFGRGFDEIDVEVFDEAQILDTKALEDMIAATNQARHEHGALLFFMGTPPRASDPSEAFTARRTAARAGESDDAVWLEIGADPSSEPDDRSQWPLMNPSFPLRTPEESLLRLRKNLSDDESWNREGRGIWDSRDLSFTMAFSLCADPHSTIVDRPKLAVSMSRDLSRVSLVAAGHRADGLVHVEVVEDGAAGDWFVPRVAEVAKRQRAQVWLHPGHPVGSLMADLMKAGVTVKTINGTQYAQGCVALHRAVMDGQVRHLGQDELDRAVLAAMLKRSGDSAKWDGDGITALVAATQAAHALRSAPQGRGRVIVLDQ